MSIETPQPPRDLQRRRFANWWICALMGCVLSAAAIVGVTEVSRFVNYQVVHNKLFSVYEALNKYEEIHGHIPVASLTDEGRTVVDGESWREAISDLTRYRIWQYDDSIHFCMIVYQSAFLEDSNESASIPSRALLCDIGDSQIAWTEHCDVYVTQDEVRMIGENTNQVIDLRGKIVMIRRGWRALVPWDLDSKDVPEFLLSVPQW